MKYSKADQIISEKGDKMISELVDTITSEETTDSVVSVADSIIKSSYNDTVFVKFKNAILNDSNYVGILYSLNFHNYKYSIVVRVSGQIVYIYPIEGKFLNKEENTFDPEDYRNMADEYFKEYGKEQLLSDLEEVFDEFKETFKEEIERRIALAIMRIKFHRFYVNDLNQIQFPH